MASLTLPKLGNVGASSLIKSASTLQSEINTFKDTQAQIDFENNPSQENLDTYLAYLNGRVTNLQSTGSITDATKALTMTQQMHSAVSTSTSFQIQNESIQIMNGTATPQDKYNYIVSAYQRAAGIGDQKLAQSLASQADSLSQQIQYQQQQAADAAKTLATANSGNQESVASNLTEGLKQLNNDIKMSGNSNMNSTLKAWVNANKATLETLGVKLPANAQPNYFDLVNAVEGGIYTAHVLAYQAELPYNPQTAQTYLTKAVNLQQGIDKLHTLGGDLTAEQVRNASANNAEFAYDQASGKLVPTKQTGFNGYDTNGQPLPTYSGAVKQTIFLTPKETTLMDKLQLKFSENSNKTTGNGVQVQTTGNTPGWLKSILGSNGITNFFSTDKGLVFEADSKTGAGKAYYTLGTDLTGKVGAFENTPDGGIKALGGEYGFNMSYNTAVSKLVNGALQQQQVANMKAASQSIKVPAAPNALPTMPFGQPASVQTPPPAITAPWLATQTKSPAKPAVANNITAPWLAAQMEKSSPAARTSTPAPVPSTTSFSALSANARAGAKL